jgi:hypothetical protein
MYKCQITGKMSKPGEKLNRVVVATRAVEYKHWDREAEEEWFSHGTEIVKEVNASDEGAALWEKLTSEERAEFVKGLN